MVGFGLNGGLGRDTATAGCRDWFDLWHCVVFKGEVGCRLDSFLWLCDQQRIKQETEIEPELLQELQAT